jgi:hypothetical protein
LDELLGDRDKNIAGGGDIIIGETESGRSSDFWRGVDWDKSVPIVSTVKELTVSEAEIISYTFTTDKYGSGTISADFNDIFVKNQPAQSVIIQEFASDDTLYAIRLSMDENGIITGMIVVPGN